MSEHYVYAFCDPLGTITVSSVMSFDDAYEAYCGEGTRLVEAGADLARWQWRGVWSLDDFPKVLLRHTNPHEEVL